METLHGKPRIHFRGTGLRQIFAIIILVIPLLDDWSKNVADRDFYRMIF